MLTGAGAAALVAGAAVVIALVAGGGGGGGPTLHEYVALGSLAPTAGPPAKSSNGPAQLAVRVDGVPFPYWEDQFGWRASGVRSGNIAGHAVTTVFYGDRAGHRVSYSIVAGKPAPLNGLAAGRAVATWRGGERYWVANVNGTPAVVWMRDGHRCILSGPGLSSAQLLALAELERAARARRLARRRPARQMPARITPRLPGSRAPDGPRGHRVPLLLAFWDSPAARTFRVRGEGPCSASAVSLLALDLGPLHVPSVTGVVHHVAWRSPAGRTRAPGILPRRALRDARRPRRRPPSRASHTPDGGGDHAWVATIS